MSVQASLTTTKYHDIKPNPTNNNNTTGTNNNRNITKWTTKCLSQTNKTNNVISKTSLPSARVAAMRSMQQQNWKNRAPFKHYWNFIKYFVETHLKLSLNTHLKLHWNISETHVKLLLNFQKSTWSTLLSYLKHPLNIMKTTLKFPWNFLEMSFKLLWKTLETLFKHH